MQVRIEITLLQKYIIIKELSALSRLGLAIILSAICCIIVQINVGETQTGRVFEQQQTYRKATTKEEEAEIRALIASRAQVWINY